ncbi:MAG TPA: phosphoribosyltransferase family protein, partial [Deltaproteobacteria bacterium]|nr:phosphoribosyltransferase family protein [Deltaproteobacteria bacterium]
MRKLYDALAISRKVSQLGEEISRSYMGKELLVVGILKGGFMFMSDLVRAVSLPTRIDFARLSSYGKSDSPEGDVKIVDDVHEDIQGVHVLVVDDIMDTGQSITAFKEHLESKGPASVKICTMINKKFRRSKDIDPDYSG